MWKKPKFCKDCAYYVAPKACHHPDNMDYNLVTGDGISKQNCDTLRDKELEQGCGPSAKWFEGKTTKEPETFTESATQAFVEHQPQQQRPTQAAPRQVPRYAIDPGQFAPPPDEGDGPGAPGGAPPVRPLPRNMRIV